MSNLIQFPPGETVVLMLEKGVLVHVTHNEKGLEIMLDSIRRKLLIEPGPSSNLITLNLPKTDYERSKNTNQQS